MDAKQKVKTPERGYSNLRKGRYSHAGNYYFVTTAAQRKEKVFLNKICADIVIDSVKWMEQHGKVENIVAIVMPDHFHWIFVLKEGELAAVMRSLKGFTSVKMNQALNRKGKVWQEQYYEHLIKKDESLLEIAK